MEFLLLRHQKNKKKKDEVKVKKKGEKTKLKEKIYIHACISLSLRNTSFVKEDISFFYIFFRLTLF